MSGRSLPAIALWTVFACILNGAVPTMTGSSTWNQLRLSEPPEPRTDEESETVAMREAAAQPVVWQSEAADGRPDRFTQIRILGINDFHGHLSAGQRVEGRPVGGAAVLASYLNRAAPTFIVHAGDHVGASPPESSFFQDEPSIAFFNLLGNRHCSFENRMDARCNLVGTPGNHEFDEGTKELLRLIEGGNHPTGPFFDAVYRGTTFPYVSSNVIDRVSGRTILPPYVIKEAGGVRLAFIGATLKETPSIVPPTGIADLRFLDEASSINAVIRRLQEEEGMHTFVVLIHQGGKQPAYQGMTLPDGAVDGQELADIVWKLDDDVDVVVSGHSHSFTNALLKNRHGKEILVTQAFSYGTAYADIQVAIDRGTGDVMEKRAAIVTAFADEGPGLTPDPQAALLVAQAEATAAPRAQRRIAAAAKPISRVENEAGESALGDLIADAQRAALDTDFAFMNPGGIRTDLPAGPLTYRDLFAVHPFGNNLVSMSLTGQEIYDLLNQQWVGQTRPRILKISGLTYTWDSRRPIGDRIVDISRNGTPLDRESQYSVTVNDFLAEGGDNFLLLKRGHHRKGGPVDVDALIAHVTALPQPFDPPAQDRISRLP